MSQSERAQRRAHACAAVDALRDEMSAVARAIHGDPEVGCDTPRSAGRLEDLLAASGMAWERDVAGLACALRARGRGTGHPAVALLVECGALPKVGRGCGHGLMATTARGGGIAVARTLAAAG